MLIVDDLSTDNTVEIVKAFAAQDARIKFFILPEKGGASLARNKAIREAKGAYIAFLDADDLWLSLIHISPIFFMLMNVAGLCIFYVASLLIADGNLQVGQLVAFMDYLFHAMFSIMLFCTVFMMYPRAEVSAKRITEVFTTKPLIQNPKQGVCPVSYTHLHFRANVFYPGKPCCNHDCNVCFTICRCCYRLWNNVRLFAVWLSYAGCFTCFQSCGMGFRWCLLFKEASRNLK